MSDTKHTVAIVDNYDSFVHTLAGYIETLGVPLRLRRNDEWTTAELATHGAVILSPGPGSPSEAGICVEAAGSLTKTPLLGICLGHQAIGEAFRCPIVRVPPTHGRTSAVHHSNRGPLRGLPNPVRLTRYHSLAIDLPTADEPDPQEEADLTVDAWTADGVVMAVGHRDRPIWGLQPHPEAILSSHGRRILFNFLRLAGLVEGDAPVWTPSRDSARPQHAAETPDFFAEPIDAAYPLPGPRNTR